MIIKKYIQPVIISLLVLSIVSYYIKYKLEIRRLNNNIIELRENYIEQWKEDSVTIIKQADIIEGLGALQKRDIEFIAHWKNSYYKIKNALQETIYEDSIKREIVRFDTTDICGRIYGHTITNPPEVEIYHIFPSFKLDIELVRVKKNFEIGKIHIDNPCLSIKKEDVKIRVPPQPKSYIIDNKWLWFGVGIGGGILIHKYIL